MDFTWLGEAREAVSPSTRIRQRSLLGLPWRSIRSWASLAVLVCCPGSLLSQTSPAKLATLRANAAAAQGRGDVAGAIRLYGRAARLEPENAETWWFLGTLQYGANQYPAARQSLDHFIRLSKDAVAAIALRGLCEFETASYAEALQDIQKAIALGAGNQPRNGQILLYHEALLLTLLGRFDEAVVSYTAFIKQGLVNDDVALGLGLAGLRVPSLPNTLDPARAELALALGRAGIQIVTGDPADGRQAALRLQNAHPGQRNIHYFCGYLLFPIDPDQAADEFNLELGVDPSNALAHIMLAWGSEFRGDFDAALPNAQKALAEDPSSSMAQLVLGRALIETSDVTRGLTHLETAIAREPENLEAHLSLAKAYSRLGRKEDARRERLLCLQLSGPGTHATP